MAAQRLVGIFVGRWRNQQSRQCRHKTLIHLFGDREERDRKRIPYLSLVGNVRYAIDAILRWEMANSVPGAGPESVVPAADVAIEEGSPKAPDRVPRWYEIVSEQASKPFTASNAVNDAANLRIGLSEMGGNERQNGCAQRLR